MCTLKGVTSFFSFILFKKKREKKVNFFNFFGVCVCVRDGGLSWRADAAVDCEVALITVFNSLASLWGVPTSRRRRSKEKRKEIRNKRRENKEKI